VLGCNTTTLVGCDTTTLVGCDTTTLVGCDTTTLVGSSIIDGGSIRQTGSWTVTAISMDTNGIVIILSCDLFFHFYIHHVKIAIHYTH
jgi:hypothetical protein